MQRTMAVRRGVVLALALALLPLLSTVLLPAGDASAVVGDPVFLGTITGPYGMEHTGPRLDRALPLRVSAESPAVDARPDAGAFEYRRRT